MVKIYTKTGDTGETSLYAGARVPKNDPFIQALGTVDEANSAIGIAISLLPRDTHFQAFDHVRSQLTIIQNTLFDLGAAIATPISRAGKEKLRKTRFEGEGIQKLEHWIDAMEENLPPLKTFILPGGHPSSASLHLARSICRRAERQVVPLHKQNEVNESVIIYLNRLSDYLFVLARHINYLTQTPEPLWEHHVIDDR